MKKFLLRFFKALTNRTFLITLVILALFSAMWTSVYRIQILDAAHYQEAIIENTFETQEIEGIRGVIYDRYGRELAVNRASLSLYYTPDANNPDLNAAILYLLDILAENEDTLSIEQVFPIRYTQETGFYFLESFNVSSNEIALYNFLAEVYNTSRDELTYAQKMSTAEEAFSYLVATTFSIPDNLEVEQQLQIAQIRYAIYAGRWTPSQPILIAHGISEKTQAAIMERRSDFVGFTVATEYTREYPKGELFAHIVGYASRIDQEELSLREDKGYDAEDIIGKTGVELSFEDMLRGTAGTKRIELDGITGERVSETTLIPATQGNSIFLTIDSDLQQQAYDALYAQIKSLLLSKITGEHSDEGKTYDVTDIFCALLDNHFIPSRTMEGSSKEEVTAFKAISDNQSEQILEDLRNTILNTSVLLKDYSEILQDTYNTMIESMRNNEHLSYAYRDDESFYAAYSEGKRSARDFLEYCFSNGYINKEIYGLTEESSIDVVLQTILDVEFDNLRRSTDYQTRLHVYVLEQRLFSNADFLYLLYEEGLISNKDKSYEAVLSGDLTIIDCLKKKIIADEITPADINLDPCSGSVVLTDCRSGEVLAMVSYPSYDPNQFLESLSYYNQIVLDKSGPLTFRALNEMRAIGSTFKMCTAITALDLGYIDSTTTVYDAYQYPNVNSETKPVCWSKVSHGAINVVEALEHSCNYFFYEMGFKLSDPNDKLEFNDNRGLKKLASYAETLGLATPTGIEIEEGNPHTSDKDAIRSAIGQGTNAFSAANVNRYTCTIANGGTVYDLYLVDSVHSARGEILFKAEPVVASETTISDEVFHIIQEGMRMMVTDEHAEELSMLDKAGIITAGKTGTAQEMEKRPDHSLFTGYASYNDPEIVVTVTIPFGGGSSNAIPVFRDVVANYYGITLDIPS